MKKLNLSDFTTDLQNSDWDEQCWEEKYAALKSYDGNEKSHFEDIDFSEASYEYSDMLCTNYKKIEDLKEYICTTFCEDVDLQNRKDVEVVYRNLTSAFSEMAKLRFRNFDIKTRIMILEKLQKRRIK